MNPSCLLSDTHTCSAGARRSAVNSLLPNPRYLKRRRVGSRPAPSAPAGGDDDVKQASLKTELTELTRHRVEGVGRVHAGMERRRRGRREMVYIS